MSDFYRGVLLGMTICILSYVVLVEATPCP